MIKCTETLDLTRSIDKLVKMLLFLNEWVALKRADVAFKKAFGFNFGVPPAERLSGLLRRSWFPSALR